MEKVAQKDPLSCPPNSKRSYLKLDKAQITTREVWFHLTPEQHQRIRFIVINLCRHLASQSANTSQERNDEQN